MMPADARALPIPEISREIGEAKTAGRVIQTLKQLPDRVRALTDQGVKPGILRETVGSA